MGRGRGRSGLWTDRSMRQVSAWCRLRKAGLRGKRLAFALWWETGVATPQARAFVDDLLALMLDIYGAEVYGRRVPADLRGRRAAVQGYVARTAQFGSPADAFGENRGHIERATIEGALGLLRQERTPEDQIGKVLPRIAGLRRSLEGTIASGISGKFDSEAMSALGLVVYAVAPYASLEDFRQAFDLLAPLNGKASPEASSAVELLTEIRISLRNALTLALRRQGARAYWRTVHSAFVPMLEQIRNGRMPRSFAPYRHFLTREGTLALGVLAGLLVHKMMTDSGIKGGLRLLNQWNWGASYDANSARAATL